TRSSEGPRVRSSRARGETDVRVERQRRADTPRLHSSPVGVRKIRRARSKRTRDRAASRLPRRGTREVVRAARALERRVTAGWKGGLRSRDGKSWVSYL